MKKKPKRSIYRKIINTFIGVFGFLIFILLLFFGFSQTKTFRNYLREKLTETYSESFNGNFYVGAIEGTILTSLKLNDLSISTGEDTLITIKSIGVNINPIKLLRRKIFVSKLEIDGINFFMKENSPGNWNLENLTKIDSSESVSAAEKDSLRKKNKFPFRIQIANFSISNSNFHIKDFAHISSDSVYKIINYSDLDLNNFKLKASVLADINSPQFQIELKELSADLNTSNFNLKKLSGNIFLSDKLAQVSDLRLITSNSQVKIDAILDSINLFEPAELKDFKNYPLNLKLKADPFNFDDLSTFVESTKILKGAPSLTLNASGVFGAIDINKLNIKFGDTRINGSGKLSKLNTPENLFIDVHIVDSKLNESDAVRLLPSIGIPDYDEFKLDGVNIKFRGEPTNFFTEFEADHKGGHLKVKGKLDVSQPELVYDLMFETENLNIDKIIHTETNITSSGNIKGHGIDPQELAADFNVILRNSEISSFTIDSLNLVSTADAKIIKLDLFSIFNNTEGEIRGSIDFNNNNLPAYNLTGNLTGFNLNDFIADKNYDSDLNFSFVASGFDLDPDNMTGNYFVEMSESKFAGKEINDSKLTLFLNKEGQHRTIKLTSGFIDIDLDGEFALGTAIQALSSQSNIIGKIISNKIYELNPANISSGQIPFPEIHADSSSLKNVEFKYGFTLKDFELVSLLLKTKEFDIAGKGKGTIKNNAKEFLIDGEIELDYLLNADKQNPIFLSKINSDVHLVRTNTSTRFDDLFGTISISGEKIILNDEFKDISADIVFNGTTILMNASGDFSDLLSAYMDGEINITPGKQLISIYDLELNYKNNLFVNSDDIHLTLSNDSLAVDDFSLTSSESRIGLLGSISPEGEMDFNLDILNFSGAKLTSLILNKRDNDFLSDINIHSKIQGTLSDPKIEAKIEFDSVGYGTDYFGNLIGNLKLNDNNLNLDFVFGGMSGVRNDTLLYLTGNIPLSSENNSEIEKRKSRPANFKLHSSGFNLAALGNLIPYTKNLKGIFTADVQAEGSIDNLIYSGAVDVRDGYFRLSNNNMGYNYAVNLNFDKNELIFKNITLSNKDNTKYPGKFTARGTAKLKGILPEEILITGSGNLAVFSPATRDVNQNIYGDLVVKSNGNWKYIYKNGKSIFTGSIDLEKADLTLAASGQTDVNTSEKIIYHIKADSSGINREEVKFRQLLTEKKETEEVKIEKSNFDYNFKININDDAKIQFLLSKVWNQRLSVLARGNLEYESINGESRTQGALELQPGSKLEFVKTFDATGKIKFESELANPYLDVTAVYAGSYNEGTDQAPKIIDVEVEMKLAGTLDKLGTNLMKNPQNIAIYKGARSIENKIRDNRYDISDAILFIYIGRLKEDLTANDKSRLAGLGNTATSFLGSALTSIINSAVGDVVSDIQVDQSGQATKIIVSGRFQNIRYSLGGTTRIQNISEANLKFEYQLLPNLLFRLERKDPVVRSFGVEEKISELGLKYRIDF